jgi:WhiB family transcriptional regulator, redox-sensing transcriptional regulator
VREAEASWTEQAACREPGVDAELFFPVSESGPALREIAAAKAICARCPVAADCRDWALRSGEVAGIWGGTTPAERRLLRRGRSGDRAAARAASPKAGSYGSRTA